MSDDNGQPEFVVVENAALQQLLAFVAQAPLPLGRDKLVQDVAASMRPVATIQAVEEEERDGP